MQGGPRRYRVLCTRATTWLPGRPGGAWCPSGPRGRDTHPVKQIPTADAEEEEQRYRVTRQESPPFNSAAVAPLTWILRFVRVGSIVTTRLEHSPPGDADRPQGHHWGCRPTWRNPRSRRHRRRQRKRLTRPPPQDARVVGTLPLPVMAPFATSLGRLSIAHGCPCARDSTMARPPTDLA